MNNAGISPSFTAKRTSVELKVIIRHLYIFLYRMLPFYSGLSEERARGEASSGGDALP